MALVKTGARTQLLCVYSFSSTGHTAQESRLLARSDESRTRVGRTDGYTSAPRGEGGSEPPGDTTVVVHRSGRFPGHVVVGTVSEATSYLYDPFT